MTTVSHLRPKTVFGDPARGARSPTIRCDLPSPRCPAGPREGVFLFSLVRNTSPPPLGGDGGQAAGVGGLAGWRGDGVAGWLVGPVGLGGLVGRGGLVGLAGWAG